MIRWIFVALALLCVCPDSAKAQGNICRTSPTGTVAPNCASEAFVTGSRGTLTPGAFASLAACSSTTEGQTADVEDSTTDIFGATITGGGSFHVLAYCNGTNWTVAGGGVSPGTGDGTVIEQKNTAGAGLTTSGNCDNTTTNAASPCQYALALTNATLEAKPSPGTTFSTTTVMLGLGATCKITPVYSGRIHIEFYGSSSNGITSDTNTFSIRFGTGTAPSAGATGSPGTQIGNTTSGTAPSATFLMSFALGGIVTGLTVGTPIWTDLAAVTNAGTGTASQLGCAAFEF